MLCLTILLLIYANFCQNPQHVVGIFAGGDDNQTLPQTHLARTSGVDRAVVQSLPFFPFSTLKGVKKGLECSICLCKFDSSEILRLLPKCQHAFHIDCIDHWFKSHSSCPICRQKIDHGDIFRSLSSRILWNASDLTDETTIELILQREGAEPSGSSSFTSNSLKMGKFRCVPEAMNENGFLDGDLRFLHRFKHRVIISDVFHNHRWSDLDSADLMLLNSQIVGSDKLLSGQIRLPSRVSWPEIDTETKRYREIIGSRLRFVRSRFASASSTRSLFPAGIIGESYRLFARKRTMSETASLSPMSDL